ncbi:ThiF family adenylyltransferase [Rhizobium oryzicola]|uniref:ThiF family adenylyltransferase n=1 Tax=Rhizobium oryzicola TaxID=1232668 RepID=A0ABT8SZ29_9HYPH|nr:ThiF family adenylyltransferase [Rhizobium oryzicola]MDO1583616.1 ThiF family adenylyltransferase [Rhizobium oryzicola]
MYWQPEGSDVVDVQEFANPLATALHDYVVGPGESYATLGECRRFREFDLLSFDLVVERPQRPVYDIRPVESLTVCFARTGSMSFAVLVARPDFPDTPHQNLMPEGFPACICVDDRPWQDTRSFYTAAELMGRLSGWFEKACQGELHGAGQPLDPLFLPDTFNQIILKNDFWEAARLGSSLFTWAVDKEAQCIFIGGSRPSSVAGDDIRLMAFHCAIEPQQMKRMKRAPRDLGQLSDFLVNAGVDFPSLLQQSIKDWVNGKKEIGDGKRITCLLVTMPQIDPTTGDVGTCETVAFVTAYSPGEIGEKMGFLLRNVSGEAKEVNFLPTVGAHVSMDGVRDVPVTMSFVHKEFDAAGAARLSGEPHADERRIVMIGAGSAGSAISEILARQGLFKWTIVDDDTLLPHNVARHTLNNQFVGRSKAMGLANRLMGVRDDVDVRAVVDNVLTPVDKATLDQQIGDAELILDASASVPVSRWASDLSGTARRLCAFFTPDGKSAVLMIEDGARSLTLRDLETLYLREIFMNPSLADHLGSVDRMQYTGACRALTNKIPMASIQVLSGLIAAGIASGVRTPDAAVKIWTMNEDGVRITPVSGNMTTMTADGWSVVLPAALIDELRQRRLTALPSETGGPLMGMFDFERRRVDVVGALPPPSDSIGTPSSFTRGVSRLRTDIENAAARTGNQIRYIGEWHSHPVGRSSRPSGTDLEQIRQLRDAMELDGLPAVSLIVAEDDMSVLLAGTRRLSDG